eukprot:COSAG01_NODE_1682_length_9500_cov_7.543666_6_plen_56_part_00
MVLKRQRVRHTRNFEDERRVRRNVKIWAARAQLGCTVRAILHKSTFFGSAKISDE